MDADYDFQIVNISLQSSTDSDDDSLCVDKITSFLPSREQQQQRATTITTTFVRDDEVTKEAGQLRSISSSDSMAHPSKMSDSLKNNEVDFDDTKTKRKKSKKIGMAGHNTGSLPPATAAAGKGSKRKLLNTDTWSRNLEKRMKGSSTDNDGLNGEVTTQYQLNGTSESTTTKEEEDSNFQTGNKTSYDNDNEFLSHFDHKNYLETIPKAFLPDHLYCKPRTRLGVLTQCQEVQNIFENNNNHYDNNSKLRAREVDQSLTTPISQSLKENRHGLRPTDAPILIGSPARHFDGNKDAVPLVDLGHYNGGSSNISDDDNDDDADSHSNAVEGQGSDSDSTSSQTPIGDNGDEAADTFIRKICEGRSRFYECLLCGKTVTRCWNALEHIRMKHRKGHQANKKDPTVSTVKSDDDEKANKRVKISSNSPPPPNVKLPETTYTKTSIKVDKKKCQEKPQRKPPTEKKGKKQKKEKKSSFLTPEELEMLVIRNPFKNFDLKRTLSVKVVMQQVTPDDIAWFNQANYLYLSADGENINEKFSNNYSRQSESGQVGRRVSNRLLQKKVDEIAEPLKYLTIYDEDDDDDNGQNGGTNKTSSDLTPPPFLFPRPPLVFDEEDEETLSNLSLLSEPGSSCHFISTAPEIPFDYILISVPPASNQRRSQQQQQQKEEDQSNVSSSTYVNIDGDDGGQLTIQDSILLDPAVVYDDHQKIIMHEDGNEKPEVPLLEEVPVVNESEILNFLSTTESSATISDLNYHVTAAVNLSEPETIIDSDAAAEPTIYSGLAQVAELISRNLLNDEGGDENGTVLIG